MTSTTERNAPTDYGDAERERAARTLDEAAARIPDLDPLPRQVVTDVLESLNTLHKQGLATIVRRLKEDPRGKELLFELVDDPGVRMLLAMHGIIRPDPMTMARSVIERVRPGLQSHGGDVELVGIEGDTAFVKLQGACNGCSMASVTMRDGVEVALTEGVPGLARVEVVPNDPEPTLIGLDQIGGLTHRPDPGPSLAEQGWLDAGDLGACPDGAVRGVALHAADGTDLAVVVVNVGGQLTAFMNQCAHQGLPLDEAVVDLSEGTLTCPWHGFCYDASNGECTNQPGAQLQQLPLRVESGRVWIRPGGGAG